MPFVRAADHVVYYELAGPVDAPVVVLANSLGTTAQMWDAQMEPLARRHRVLRYDMRGHGLTEGAAGADRVTVERLADDVAALLDVLRIERVRFVGCSIGGMVGQRFAAVHPRRTDRLVLCATASRIGTAESWNERVAAVRAHGVASIVEAGLTRWFTERTRRENTALVRGFATMLARTPVDGYAAGCEAVRDADLRADDARITCPTLIVEGANDAVTTPVMGEELCAAIGGARLRVLDDAAHILCAEQPAAFNAAVLPFLEESA